MRRSRFATPSLPIVAVLMLALAGAVGTAPADARQTASPAAGTPAAPVQPTAPPAQPTAPAATPAQPATTDVVTLALWYENAPDQDILNLLPLTVDAGFVAGSTEGSQVVGTVDFPADGSPPTITLGETTFTSYARPDGFVERWTWFDDFEGARPGTLVMQIAGAGGAYQDFFGTATFVSRDEGGVGGLLTIAIRPPSPEAATDEAAAAPAEAPAEAAPAEDAAAAAPAADEAIAPDVTAEPGTEIIAEPDPEGEPPGGIEGEAVGQPAA